MKNAVKPIPDGYHSVTPYLIIQNAAKAIEFYKKAFAATSVAQMEDHHGKVMHAEIKVGNSIIMMADEAPEYDAQAPQTLGGSPISLHLYVEDVDQFFNRAIAAGGITLRPVQDQFYGDRSGTLRDPFGHTWTVSTHKEDLSLEEINKRVAEMEKHHSCC